MATFYAKYPASNPSSVSVTTVQGEGTAGTPVGGVLTVQGDPAGTPIPITGSITATNPSVAPTGAAVPADATYVGVKSGANLVGLALGQGLMAASVPVAIASDQSAVPVSGTVTANQGGAPWSVTGSGAAGTAATGVVTIQGIASMTAVKVDNSAVTQWRRHSACHGFQRLCFSICDDGQHSHRRHRDYKRTSCRLKHHRERAHRSDDAWHD